MYSSGRRTGQVAWPTDLGTLIGSLCSYVTLTCTIGLVTLQSSSNFAFDTSTPRKASTFIGTISCNTE